MNETLRLASDNNVPFYGAWYLDQEMVLNNSNNTILPPCDPSYVNDTFCSDSNLTWDNSISTIPACDNATWCFDPNSAFTGKTPRQHNEIAYTPNASNIGYHSITFRGAPLMGVPYENIHEWKDVFVGTLFVADNDIVNAITGSNISEPLGNFSLTTFVGNTSGIFVQDIGDSGQIQYIVSSNFDNLTDGANGIAKKTVLGNGTNYVTSYNTTDKNGTFTISLNKPYAEKLDGQRINVSVTAGQVKISPRYDIDANFAVNIIDYTILNQNWGKTGDAMCPQWQKRCDINKDNIVNIVDKTLLQQKMGKPIITI